MINETGSPFLMIYPNPADDKITIQYKIESISSLEINLFNSPGQLILQKTFTAPEKENKIEIKLDNYPEGLYVINFKYADKSYFQKLVIK